MCLYMSDYSTLNLLAITPTCVTGWFAVCRSVSHDHSNKAVISSKASANLSSVPGRLLGLMLRTVSDASMGVVTLFLLNVTRFPCVLTMLTMLYNMEFGGSYILPCLVPQFFNWPLRLYLLYSHISQSTPWICRVPSTCACINYLHHP